jgi:hypothetical protein
MTPPIEIARDWHARLARCRQWADLLRADPAGGRLAALAHDIEQRLERLGEIKYALQETREHRARLRAEVAVVIGQSRAALFFTKELLRNHPYSSDQLREESRLCQAEAHAAHDGETRRDFARCASDFAMLGEAVSRRDGHDPS